MNDLTIREWKCHLSSLDLDSDQSTNQQDYEYANDKANDIWNALQDMTDEEGLADDPSFPRQHRYDTKKPGPGYYIHESDSSSRESDPDLDRALERIIDEVELEQQEQQEQKKEKKKKKTKEVAKSHGRTITGITLGQKGESRESNECSEAMKFN